MTVQKLLVVSDLHYCTDLAAEIAAMQSQLPPDTYDHMREGRLYWHNEMLVEAMERMLTAVVMLATRERPDLVIFLGDLVNTNWQQNVTRLAAQLGAFDCPTTMVTGNHDIYLDEPRIQEFITPGDFETGIRHQLDGDVGLIFMDLYVHYENGAHQKRLHWQGDVTGLGYRPVDVETALQLLTDHPQTPFLLFGHFPIAAPASPLFQPGRKIGRQWPSGQALLQALKQPNNLLGVICGHQHFAHLQQWKHGFHWTLPALVEYPCSVALIEVDKSSIRGRLVQPDPTISADSLRPLNQRWVGGTLADQQLHRRVMAQL